MGFANVLKTGEERGAKILFFKYFFRLKKEEKTLMTSVISMVEQ